MTTERSTEVDYRDSLQAGCRMLLFSVEMPVRIDSALTEKMDQGCLDFDSVTGNLARARLARRRPARCYRLGDRPAQKLPSFLPQAAIQQWETGMNQLFLKTFVPMVLSCTAISPMAEAHEWLSLYSFGDSYTDSGAGYVDGNGPTAVVYLAQRLGIPFTYATDRDPAGKGLNFAVSGAQTGSSAGIQIRQAGASCLPADALFNRGLQAQVLDFAYRVKSKAIRFDPSKTLFFVAGGLNDRFLPTTVTVSNLKQVLRQLYGLGARNFILALLPTKIPDFAETGRRLNPALAKIPGEVEADSPGARIYLSHWGEYFDRVFERPGDFGFANTTDRCAGRAVFGEEAAPCQNPRSYFYFHSSHPSTAVHEIVAGEMAKEIAEGFPD